MRVLIIFVFLAMSFSMLEAKAASEKRTLTNAVSDYQALKKELDETLKNQTSCSTSPGMAIEQSASLCSIKNYCDSAEIKKDSPNLYQNAAGESIVNRLYYKARKNIEGCLKSKYQNEIALKRDEMTSSLKAQHLKKIMAANQKLITLTAKYGQGANLSRIRNEILTMSLETELNGDEVTAGSKNDLLQILKTAEKRSKTTLKSDIENTLIEIDYLKKNPLYLAEVVKMEEALIPKDTIKKDLFNDFNLLKSAEAAGGEAALKANRDKYTQKVQAAYDLFLETQKEMLEYLEKQKNETNIESIERAKVRVQNIHFEVPRLTSSLEEECVYPNAYYKPSTHSFHLCPQNLNFPRSTLKETMAHELAHSIDPCNLSGEFFKDTAPEEVEEAPFDIEIKMAGVSPHYKNGLIEDPARAKPESKIQGKMKYSDNPFSKTISCLQDPLSVGAIVVNPDDIKKKTEDSKNILDHLGQNNPNNRAARSLQLISEKGPDYFDYFQGCNNDEQGGVLGRSQIQEAFADKIASEIIASDFKKLNPSNSEEARKKMLEVIIDSDVCTNQGDSEMKLRAFAIKEKCEGYIETLNDEAKLLDGLKNYVAPAFDHHPDSSVRIERNLMAHPEIRKALNCKEETGVKYCE